MDISSDLLSRRSAYAEIKIIGFMNPKNVRFELNVKNSIFLYPDERVGAIHRCGGPSRMIQAKECPSTDLFRKYSNVCSLTRLLPVTKQVRSSIRVYAKNIHTILCCSNTAGEPLSVFDQKPHLPELVCTNRVKVRRTVECMHLAST